MSRKVPRLKAGAPQRSGNPLNEGSPGQGGRQVSLPILNVPCLQLPGGPCWLRGGGKMMVSEAVVRRRRIFQPAAPTSVELCQASPTIHTVSV